MSQRFFSAEPIQADRVRLTGPEAHHLLHVLRAPLGTRVVLFDGSGWEFEAELVGSSRQEADLLIHRRAYVDRELPILLVLGVAMPKGDRPKWLVEKAVELGVGRLVPLIAARSVAHPGQGTLARLRRTVIEASKQCGRNHLMAIDPPMSWQEWLTAYSQAELRWIAHPPGPSLPEKFPPEPSPHEAFQARQWPGLPELPTGVEKPGTAKKVWAVAVGPEGGWTDSELADSQTAGWQPVGLGPRVLRTETAALALAASLAFRMAVSFPVAKPSPYWSS